MKVYSFPLRVTKQLSFITLRELNGHDELFVAGKDTAAVIDLFDNIIMPYPSADVLPIDAKKITVSDRDFLLACVYKYTYGPKVESHIHCQNCNTKFDINFLLDDLIAHTWGNAKNVTTEEDGYFFLEDGSKFRLPAGEDELAVYRMDAKEAQQEMIQRCLKQPLSDPAIKRVFEAMEAIAPVLVIDTTADCPECGKSNSIRFDMQSFMLAKMFDEKKRLMAEIHFIASAYRWSHKEILDLPRTLRKTYAEMAGLN